MGKRKTCQQASAKIMIKFLLFQDAEKFDEGGVNLTVCLSNDPSSEFHWNHITDEHLAKKVMDVMKDSKDPRVQLAFNQYRPSGIVRLEYSGKQRIPIIGVIGFSKLNFVSNFPNVFILPIC